MKPVSVEEAIAEIEEVLEENEISPDENVVRAAPTGPLMPLLPTPTSENPEVERLYQNAVERHIDAHGEPPNPFQAAVLRRHAEMETGLTTLQSPVGPVTSPGTPTELSLEELIAELEQHTKESLYQESIEKFTACYGEPSDTIKSFARTRAALNYYLIQTKLRVLKYFQNRPPTEMCPVEREQLDRYGELLEVSREEGETDEAYRERLLQRAWRD